MVSYNCKECGKEFTDDNEEELVERIHDHLHVDHGKHVGRKKIRSRMKD